MGLKESGLRGSLRSTSSVLPAFFDVTITNTNSPVQEGDILTVDYSADNTGDAQDTQDIRLEIDSVEEDRDSDITLLGAQSTTGTLEWDTTDEDETTYTATVLSDDDTDSVTVEIEDAIPDKLVSEYSFGNFSEANWPDDIGDIDIDNIDGLTADGDAFDGKGGVQGSDGDSGNSEPQTIWDVLDDDFAVGVAIETSDSNGSITGLRDDSLSNTQIFEVTVGDGQNQGNTSGRPALGMRDKNGDQLDIEADVDVDDGSSTHIIFNKVANSGSDAIEIWIDRNQVETSVNDDAGFDGTDATDERWGYFGTWKSDDSEVVSTLDCSIHKLSFYDDSLSESEIDSEFDRIAVS